MRYGLVNLISAASALGLIATSALAVGPFDKFGGEWRGTGRVTDKDGRTETLRCRSTDAPSQDGIAMNLSLVCASDSYRVDFHSNLYTDGRNLHGTWTETTRNAQGEVQGEINPDLINATTSAPGFTGHVVIRVNGGRRLDVTLDAEGTSIKSVAVSMKRT